MNLSCISRTATKPSLAIRDVSSRVGNNNESRSPRALLKNAPVLLLDEAMSALDSEAEREIQAALDRLSEGRTVIAIAHRLSTVLKADQIVVMDRGEIREIGTHRELLESSTIYRRLYDLQFNVQSEELAGVG